MKFNINDGKKIAKWVLGIVFFGILLYLGVRYINYVASAFLWMFNLVRPLVIGFVLALIINVPMRFIESHLFSKTKRKFLLKLRRPMSLVLSFLSIIGILIGIIWLVIPELVDAVLLLADTVKDYATRVIQLQNQGRLSEIPFGSYLANFDWSKVSNSVQDFITTEGSQLVNTAVGKVSSVIGGIVDFFIAIIFSVYILISKETLKKQVVRLVKVWLPAKFGKWLIHAGEVAGGIFRNFVSGQTLEGLILGLLCFVGMLILQLPYSPMVSVLVGVFSLIPVVGAFIAAFVGAFMIFTVSPFQALVFLIFLVVLQQLEGNLIYPRVMGSKINLPAMWVLTAVTIGGSLAGAVGMLFCIPVFSTIYVLVKEATQNRENKLAENSFAETTVDDKLKETPQENIKANEDLN